MVSAAIVDANGSYNTLSGYPKTFDSRSYSGDVDKAKKRAEGEFHECFGAMCKRDDRQLQTVLMTTADGFVLEKARLGAIADDPDPEPEPEPAPEPEEA